MKPSRSLHATVPAVEQLRRQRSLESANAGFAAIKGDSGDWRGELEERRFWESTVADGLREG